VERTYPITVRSRGADHCLRESEAVSGSRRLDLRRLLCALVVVWIVSGAPVAHADSVVLIVSASSSVQQLGSVELRKAFMAFDVVVAGTSLRAARNRSDARLDKIFFQNVVDLSELVYERQLLSRKLQKAATLPVEFADETRLLEAVARDPRLVSYAWATAVAKRSDLRILRILWND
jgi:hypothetical protein